MALRIVGRSQRCGDKRLRLATREQSRAMHAWKNANLDGYSANLIEGTVVGADALVEDLLTEDVFAEKFVVLAELLRSGGILGRQLFLQLILDLLDESVGLELRMLLRVESILEAITNFALQGVQVVVVDLDRSDRTLRLSSAAHEVFDPGADLLDLDMRELDGSDNLFFRALLRARLDHHDAVFGADDHDVQRAHLAFRIGGIHEVISLNQANADRANRAVERDI